MAQNERALESEIVVELRKIPDVVVIKHRTSGRLVNGRVIPLPEDEVGAPDLILSVSGVFVGMEIKAGRGVQSDDQKVFERLCDKHGAMYFVVRSKIDAVSIVEEIRAQFMGQHLTSLKSKINAKVTD